MKRSTIVLHFDLVQDVSTLRPLALLAASRLDDLVFLVSRTFLKLDSDGRWKDEIDRLATATGAAVLSYQSEFDAVRLLTGRRGICIAGSESNVRAHRNTHDLFRSLPGDFLRITLQHGFECVGFLHNARHTAALGRDIRFAADIVVSWFARRRLQHLSEAEAAKLYVAGPTSMILSTPRPEVVHQPYLGIACENTHSVRFSSGKVQTAFLRQMEFLAGRLAQMGKDLHLRPHPAGMFLSRSQYKLPPTMQLCDAPLFELDLRRYSFAMSAPSTILFDFVLAGVPVAIWGAEFGFDAQNFEGLTKLYAKEDCWNFVSASVLQRRQIVERQNAFLADLGIPDDIAGRYAALLALVNN